MAIYGATLFKSPKNGTNFGYDVIGKNSEVFAAGDPVTIDATAGTLRLYTTTNPIAGVIVKAATMSSTNDTVALVKPARYVADEDDEFLMGCNTALVATSVGTYYKLTGATGAVQVDTTSGAQTLLNRVVVCTAVDPNGLSDLTQGLFKFVKVYGIRDN